VQYSIFDDFDTYKYIALIFFGILFLKVAFLFTMITLLKLFNNLKKVKEIPLSRHLVVLQFMGAFILVNLAILFHNQLKFMLSKDLGYNKDNVLFVEKFTMGSGPNSLTLDHLEAFKGELAKHSLIQNISLSSLTPGYYHHSNQRAWLNASDKVFSNTIWIDKDYVNGYGLKLIAGRNISGANANEVLINETLMRSLGVTDASEIVGKPLYIDESMAHHMVPGAKEIVGVLKDYNQEPLSKAVAPTKYHYVDANRGYYSIKYSGNDHTDMLNYTKKTFNKFFPEDEFNYSFLDQFINAQYNSDIQFKELINITTLLSIVIASLGIFGLITYSLEVHRKASAIRMILGSSIFGLFSFFIRSYLIYFVIVIVLAMPLTILLASNVISNYAYHIEVNYFLFLIPALPIFGVILFIIGVQVMRAGSESPIKALRTE
jgi:putative ABC transport system permease protein